MSDTPTNLPPRFLRTPEAARFLGLSGRTLEKHRYFGTGPAYRRIGGRANLDFQVSPRLSMSTSLALSGERNDRVEADDNLEGIVGNAIAHEPYFPVRQPDGSVSHYLAIKNDITRRREIEAELEQHRHHLDELVQARHALPPRQG